MNAAEDIQVTLLESCRRQLIEEGKMVLTDAGYSLTERGRQAVEKELRQRYEFRPAMLTMIEVYIMNINGCSKWE